MFVKIMSLFGLPLFIDFVLYDKLHQVLVWIFEAHSLSQFPKTYFIYQSDRACLAFKWTMNHHCQYNRT